MMAKLKYTFIFIFILFAKQSIASHIVGYDFNYSCLGGNNYQFTFKLYRDCINGMPGALTDDNPAIIYIFRGNTLISRDTIFQSGLTLVPPNFSNDCVNNPPVVCLSQITFQFSKYLPPDINKYTIAYQRCCRNGSIENLINPKETGVSYYINVPQFDTLCNNSASYLNFPPQIICVNNPFIYNHSAIDIDGDSLSYEFCEAYKGGTQTNPKPIVPPPPYQSVFYNSPYSALNPMAGSPQIQINPVTGMITGTPNLQGRFVVAICCNEWRNGVIINTVRREFQFEVTNCSKAVVANTPVFSEEPNTYIVNCKDYTVNFKNISSGAFAYDWDFGDPSSNLDVSSTAEPTYTYPDTGTFVVKLIVNKGSTCPDSISRIVKIYPEFNTDFIFSGKNCPGETFTFTDQSTSTYFPVDKWTWNFDDNSAIDNAQNPFHIFPNMKNGYNVTLISGNSRGCLDTMTKNIPVEFVNVFAGNDTIFPKNTFFPFQGSGALSYLWTPNFNLNFDNISNPIGDFPNTGYYDYILKGITENGCIGYDTIKLTVTEGPYIFVPNAFSPNGDGQNDFLKIFFSGFKKINFFRIYNRFGQLVFQTNDINTKGWDGNFKGSPAILGTYFWYMNAIDEKNVRKEYKGDILLIK